MRTTVILCDLDDAADRRPGVGVVRVTIEGAEYELDVCKEHLQLLRALPASDGGIAATRARPARAKQSAARATAKPKRSSGSTANAPKSGPAVGRKPGSRRDKQARIAAARDWARAQGREVAERGRLPAGLLEEFESAHSS